MATIDVMISEEEIAKKVEELAKQIEKDYEGEQLLVVGILKGASVFVSDLIRKINLDVNIEYKEYKKQGIKTSITHNRLIPQKQEGLYSVYFHPVCGQLSMSNYKLLIDKLDKLEDIEIRLSMNEGMYIRNLNGEEAVELINLTQNLGGETKLEQSVA